MTRGVSRRDLFTFWRKPPAVDPPAAPAPAAPPRPSALLRPPGALPEALFLGTCTRSGHCALACPRQAIFLLDPSFGRAAGTPMIRARAAPCVVCEGLECTRACPSGALARIGVAELRMGTAAVDAAGCVTWRGQSCRACVDACPIPGAIALHDGAHPVVDAARCTGCGVCEHVCPTEQASIAVTPARSL